MVSPRDPPEHDGAGPDDTAHDGAVHDDTVHDGTGPDGAGVAGTEAAPLYEAFLIALPITGASISVFSAEGQQSTIGASDDLAAQIEQKQFDLGEGPHWVALRTGRPVLVPDVRSDTGSGWPFFALAMRELNARALFAFPLLIGAVVVGVVDLYRIRAGPLDDRNIATAASLARQVATPAVRIAIRGAESDAVNEVTTAPALRREVHQAIGMVIVQLETNATEAFSRLRAHAFSTGRSVQEVAHDVVNRRLDFSQLPE